MNSTRWKNRPAGSTWGDFGPDDQLGRLNLLTPARVKRAVKEVKEGITFCLSLPLDYPGGNILNPRRHPPILRPTLRNGKPNMNYQLGKENPDMTDVINDDVAIIHLQYSTQWDSLAHVGHMFDADGEGHPEPVFYNGYKGGVDIIGPSDPDDAGAVGIVPVKATSHAKALGVENMAVNCVQGRGVMIDIHAHVAREHAIIGYEKLMRIMEADKVVVEEGDMVCIHTGFSQILLDMKKKPDANMVDSSCAVLDGRDQKLLKWITDSGLVSLIADNYAVEAHPATSQPACCAALPIHEHCLFKLGVNLGEMWYLTQLADWLRANKRSRFLLTAPPLRLPGAVGSPATPVATV